MVNTNWISPSEVHILNNQITHNNKPQHSPTLPTTSAIYTTVSSSLSSSSSDSITNSSSSSSSLACPSDRDKECCVKWQHLPLFYDHNDKRQPAPQGTCNNQQGCKLNADSKAVSTCGRRISDLMCRKSHEVTCKLQIDDAFTS